MRRFKILAFIPEKGELTVEFEGAFQMPILLPITANKFPEGDELLNLIRAHEPHFYYERKAQLEAVTNKDAVLSMLGKDLI